MWRSAISRWWETQRIYYTQVYQEIWVGLALTTYVYYKISYGGKICVFLTVHFYACLPRKPKISTYENLK